jgi:hypothetical protein
MNAAPRANARRERARISIEAVTGIARGSDRAPRPMSLLRHPRRWQAANFNAMTASTVGELAAAFPACNLHPAVATGDARGMR